MSGIPKVEFKRDAAPDRDDNPPFSVVGAYPPRIVNRDGRHIRDEPADTFHFLCTAANERAAMLAEIDRLRQAVVDEREACAAQLDAAAIERRAEADKWLSRGLSHDEADKRLVVEAGLLAKAAAAIRARSTP